MSVYNGAQYLREAVDSILTQTYSDFEFIVIDDGSTDHTWEVLNCFVDPRIRLVRNTENIGLTESLNKGLGLATGEYIARMDADDIGLPRRLEKQVAFLNTHPEIGVLGTAVQIIDGQEKKSSIRRYPTQDSLIGWHLCFEDPIAHPTTMIRTDLLREVGGYNQDMATAQDYDLWRRLRLITQEANSAEVLLYLRRHEACITRARHDEQVNNSIIISGTMIADTLNEEAPMQVVQNLWNKEFGNDSDILAAADLIHRLYWAYVANNTLSVAEKGIIRRDAAKRLLRLIRYAKSSGSIRLLIRRTRQLDPLAIVWISSGWLYRMALRGFLQMLGVLRFS